jgi:SAM-dependent methyltransferase
MTPDQVAASYDRIADRWLEVPTYGFAQVERAVAFVKRKGAALDVGCGTGRLMGLLNKHDFRTDGVDASPAMVTKPWLTSTRSSPADLSRRRSSTGSSTVTPPAIRSATDNRAASGE